MTNARLDELRAKFQENPRRYFAPFANELRKAGDPAQAIAVCRTHLAGQPGHVSGHIVLGQALYEAGEPNEARDVFTAALELDPENLIALRTLGEIAQVNGDFGGARQWYERLLEADPRNTEVTQLLKDIPTEAAPAPVASAPVEPLEEPTPFTVRADYESPPPAPEPLPPVPVPTFHTSFTGSQRAYDPVAEQKEPEPALDELQTVDAAQQSDEPFIDLEPTAHDEQPAVEMGHEPVAAGESEPLAMVDFDDFPHESPDEPALEAPDEVPVAASTADVTHEDHHEPVVAEGAEFSIDVDEAPAAVEGTPVSEFAPPEPTTEHSHAVFAERGFDGPAEDEVGWMTTPSAAFSDLEAAPDAWFDESVRPESEEGPAEPPAAEPAVAEASPAADFTSDSWFDEVPGAAVIESIDVTPSDLWLPPEIPQVTQAEDNTSRVTDESEETPALSDESEQHEPELVETSVSETPAEVQASSIEAEPEEPAMQAEAPEEAQVADQPLEESVAPPLHEEEEPRWAAQSEAAEHPAPAWMDVEAVNDEGGEPTVVEHPDESPVAATWMEPEPATPDEEHVESIAGGGYDDSVAMEAGSTAVPDLESVASAEASSAMEPSMDAATDEVPAGTASVIGRTPAFGEDVAAPAPTPAPFITETLAELYLQQGFRDEALSIYRQLSERDPANESLKTRVAAIEQRDVPAADAPDIRVESSVGSQSVRTFFSRLARRPAVSGGQSFNAPTTGVEPNPDVPFASAGSALANLFSASRPPAPDEGAASTLAGAFSDPAGRPSRAAERELSLDHLFRDVPAGGSPAGGVTLDEFYSTPDATSGSPTEPGEAGGSEESGGADIRQFTAWLEGLRKK